MGKKKIDERLITTLKDSPKLMVSIVKEDCIDSLCQMCRETLFDEGKVKTKSFSDCNVRKEKALCKQCDDLAQKLADKIICVIFF